MSEPTCALWFWRHFSPDYELCDTEEEAARFGVYMTEAGDGAVAGIQFADGRYVPLPEWQAFKVERDRQHAEYDAQAAERAKRPPPRVRRIRCPFPSYSMSGTERPPREITVLADEPEWLGSPL